MAADEMHPVHSTNPERNAMPATIVYSARAEAELSAMQEGGYSQAQIAELKQAVTEWVDQSFQGWAEGNTYHQSFHVKYGETVYAEMTDQEAGEVTIQNISYA